MTQVVKQFKFFVQPLEWGELDSDWAECVDSLEEGNKLAQELSTQENGKTMVVWELEWQTGSLVQRSQVTA